MGGAFGLTLETMKLTFIAALLFVTAAQAASDTDVTIIKAEKVVIEENVVTIVAEAKTSIITLSGDYQADYKGATFMGRPMNQVTVKSDKATLVIRRPDSTRPGARWRTRGRRRCRPRAICSKGRKWDASAITSPRW